MGISFVNNGIITGTIQAVSKFTSEGASRQREGLPKKKTVDKKSWPFSNRV